MFTFELSKSIDLESNIKIKKLEINEPKVLHCELWAEISQQFAIMDASYSSRMIKGIHIDFKNLPEKDENTMTEKKHRELIQDTLKNACEGKSYFYDQMLNFLISRGISVGIDQNGEKHTLIGKKGFFQDMTQTDLDNLCFEVIINFLRPFKESQ